MRGKDFTPDVRTGQYDLDALLHPAQAFDHPDDVIKDPDLSLNEKRAILASWASDACAVEAAPALRCASGAKRVVAFDEVMDALRALDHEAQEHYGDVRPRRLRPKWRFSLRNRRSDDSGNDRHGPLLRPRRAHGPPDLAGPDLRDSGASFQARQGDSGFCRADSGPVSRSDPQSAGWVQPGLPEVIKTQI